MLKEKKFTRRKPYFLESRLFRLIFAIALLSLVLLPKTIFAAGPGENLPSWLSFLANPWIRNILLAIGCIAIVVEFFLPTYGIASIIALVAFVLFFISSYALGDSSWLEIIFFLAGAILLLIEVTIEGFGIVGIAGIIFVVLGIIGSAENPRQGVFQLASSLVVAIVIGALLVKAGYSSRFMSKSVLSTSLSSEEGFLANKNHSELLHQVGYALTSLRPSGEIVIDDNRYDAMSQGDFIEKGSSVKVIKVENGQILVEKV